MDNSTNKRLFDFLDKYKNSFTDLTKLSNYDDEDIRKMVHAFINDMYDFAFTYDMNDYYNAMNHEKQFFDGEGKPSRDLFLYLFYIVRHEHGSYDPVCDILSLVCTYQFFSTISVSEAINKILEVNYNKKYLVIDDTLYCTYQKKGYKYDMSNWIICDCEIIDDKSGCFEKSEEEVINKYGVNVVLKTLWLF